jgi:hypothetical protein
MSDARFQVSHADEVSSRGLLFCDRDYGSGKALQNVTILPHPFHGVITQRIATLGYCLAYPASCLMGTWGKVAGA